MKRLITILIVVVTLSAGAFAQNKPNDCEKIHQVIEAIGKIYSGSPEWPVLMDSAIRRCPTYARAWGDRAMAYMIRGKFIEGVKYLNRAVELDSFYYLGNRSWYRIRHLRDYEGALADLRLLEKIAGTKTVYVSSVHFYMWMGMALQQMGKDNEALAHYNFAIEDQIKTNGENWVGMHDYLNRGILRLKMGDVDGALSDLNKQVATFETLADPYYFRAQAYSKLGRSDEAKTDALRCKELLLGAGQKRWDVFGEIPNEVFLSDVEKLIAKLY